MSDTPTWEPTPEQLALKVGDEVEWRTPCGEAVRCRVDEPTRKSLVNSSRRLIGVSACPTMVDLRNVKPANCPPVYIVLHPTGDGFVVREKGDGQTDAIRDDLSVTAAEWVEMVREFRARKGVATS